MSHRTRPRGSRRLALLRRKLHLTDEQVDTLRERFAEHHEQGRQILRDVLDEEQTERLDRHLERRPGRRGRRRPSRKEA